MDQTFDQVIQDTFIVFQNRTLKFQYGSNIFFGLLINCDICGRVVFVYFILDLYVELKTSRKDDSLLVVYCTVHDGSANDNISLGNVLIIIDFKRCASQTVVIF